MIITKGMIHVEAMFINETFLSDQESPSIPSIYAIFKQ